MGPVVNKKVAAITYVYQSVYLLLLTGLLVYVVNVIFRDYLDKQKNPAFYATDIFACRNNLDICVSKTELFITL